MMEKAIYRVEVLQQFLVLAYNQDHAMELYAKGCGDLEDESILDVYFVNELEDDNDRIISD